MSDNDEQHPDTRVRTVQIAIPDLSGDWSMDIKWHRGDKSGQLTADAVIRQDATGISMEVYSSGSDSHTLFAQFGSGAVGKSILYYIFEVEPKAIQSDADGPYKGAAILRFYSKHDQLRGNYWTSQASRGRYSLVRKS